MAERWAQHLKDKVIEPYSAGIIARGLNPRAVAVMKNQVTHVPFDDPPSLAKSAKSEDETLAHFRRVRDEIRVFIETLPLK